MKVQPIRFTVHSGYDGDGQPRIDRYLANRDAAARVLRRHRKAGDYIERLPRDGTGHAYYVEPWKTR